SIEIRSPSNPAVKRIRQLRSRRHREESGLFFAEGLRLAVEASKNRDDVMSVVVCPELLRSTVGLETAARLREAGVEAMQLGSAAFASISDRDQPQGIGVVARRRLAPIDSIDPSHAAVSVALVGPQDPGNVGSIMRTLDAVGGSTLIFVGAHVDPYDPRSVRASMGSIFSVTLAVADMPSVLDWKRRAATAMIGVTGDGNRHYRQLDYADNCILLFGSEREGLSGAARDACDDTAFIPMEGRADSLNLSVAAGIVLYEAYDRRTRRHPASH
ncbi:MAG TPA: RNA methyltransferase, partial [Chloroflexota bacterium]|nr:RNA methyltransferase [Chloroflexota bacterium]